MYRLYRSYGLVLNTVPEGEGDRMYVIFSRDLGLVYAHARSVREERSKLRYSLQPYTVADLSFIRGKHAWRIVGAQSHYALHELFKDNKKKVLVLERITGLLTRLLQGEGNQEPLFALVHDGLLALRDAAEEAVEAHEIILVLRILHALGYVSTEARGEPLASFINSRAYTPDLLSLALAQKKLLIPEINKSLAASHL